MPLSTVSFDLDRLVRMTAGRRVGVVTTPAGWLPGIGALDEYLVHRADVRAFLALEHGLRGELQDGVHFDSYQDARTRLPVFSFYTAQQGVPAGFLDGVDVVVFNVQDVSHRAYTFKTALASLLTGCVEHGVACVVLDRPTPLAHLGAWGFVHRQFFPRPLPIGIPLTLGELARWLAREEGLDIELQVVPVSGWRRDMVWGDTGLPWAPPSPNVPTLMSAYAYACTGLLQATNVSEGRGTCKPFEYVGAPFVDGYRLTGRLNGRRLAGVCFRDVFFKPAFGKYAGDVCAGTHLIVQDPSRISPFCVSIAVLQELARLHGSEFEPGAGLSEWLDGEAWSVARLMSLDTDAVARGAGDQARSFLLAAAGDCLYADSGR